MFQVSKQEMDKCMIQLMYFLQNINKSLNLSMFTKIIHMVFIVPVDVCISGTENENNYCSNFTSHGVMKTSETEMKIRNFIPFLNFF